MSAPTKTPESSAAYAPPTPFPAAFYVANAIELFERLAFYGAYVSLSLYLSTDVGLGDAGAGDVMALYAFFRLGPILGGVIADRIGFRIALVVSLATYALGYLVMLFANGMLAAQVAIVLIGVAGALFKPIITGTVVRTSPKGRQTEGFAIFYRIVNAGSVVGKLAAYGVRTVASLRVSLGNAVVASVLAVGLAAFVFREPSAPSSETEKDAPPKEKPTVMQVLRGVGHALKDWRFTGALLILSGFYFMAEQFYQTFPSYIARALSAEIPREVISLANPLMIALFQSQVTARSKQLSPLGAMVTAMFVGSASMLVMGVVGNLWGAALSFAIFAFAEMIFAPRFYDYVARFAPPGQEATFMGISVLPVAVGGMIGGIVSGRLIARFMPEEGVREPLVLWASYAGLGLVCALAMAAFHRVASRPATS